jgi:ubiquinone/menaquinone biosynthesis C-methylase UbiE
MFKKRVLQSILFLFPVLFYAQTYPFASYGVKEGLSQSNVSGIIQDSAGYYWLATESGVSRFDGKEFTSFTTENGLADNNVSAIFLDKNNKILDLGCGTGRFLEFANYGVDISPKMIEVAKTKFPKKEIIEGSVSSIPFPENHFDVIYSLHVIMHLNKEITQAFLIETHKKLKSNGKLIFDFPSDKRSKKSIIRRIIGMLQINSLQMKS